MTDHAVEEFPTKGHLLTTKEASLLLFGVDAKNQRYRLYSMIDNGEVRAHKLGRRWYVNRQDCLSLAGID